MSIQPFRSVFNTVHDVAIFGAGWAGFAAARHLVEAGLSVVLVDRDAAVLVESGRGFQGETGELTAPGSREWFTQLEARHLAKDGLVDGAGAEIVANEWLRQQRRAGKLGVLYYANALAVQIGDGLEAVLLGTKGGMKRLAARRWIDCTDTGELVALLAREAGQNWAAPAAASRTISLFFRHADWPELPGDWEAEIAPGARLRWGRSIWEHERCLRVTLEDGAFPEPRGAWLPALRAVREEFPNAMAEAVLSHGSVQPFDVYSRNPVPAGLPANVQVATPWASGAKTLAERYGDGLEAASGAQDLVLSNPSADAEFDGTLHWTQQTANIAVAGLGTGGALATLAAARQGGGVVGFDPLQFCGGIGSGGGIHVYYFGLKGGLQDEVDLRIREVMPLFGARGQIRGFHPDAKKCVLEAMLLESGATLSYGATLLDVECDGPRVTAALLGTPSGPVRLTAGAWIDSTGDGDLAARAGADVHFGRDGDGLLHAYSQSAGWCSMREGKAIMEVVNFDAGYVDSTDSEDMTRARLEGIAHYLQSEYTEDERTTYIAPAIGLRQSRHIDCDYMLTWADQMARQRFPDSIGLTGCHYDNHAMDLEFESDESLFWAGVCRGFRVPAGSEIPYRSLLPRGIENVWLACRALGVTQDAHHSMRMQRDMQRIGEVAGLAASMAPAGASRGVDFGELRGTLIASGALKEEAPGEPDGFGWSTDGTTLLNGPGEQLAGWLETLRNGSPGADFWHLYRAGQTDGDVRQAVLALLDDESPRTSWRAAAIAAMWDEPAAEGPLMRQLADRHNEVLSEEDAKNPRAIHNWFLSISLLRRVGTAAVLPLLAEVAAEEPLLHNVRTAIALCCEAIAARHELEEADRELVLEILSKLIQTPAPNSVAPPQHGPLAAEYPKPAEVPTAKPAVREDLTWQIHLTVARARHVLGLPLHAEGQAYLADDRALVRRGFEMLAVGQEIGGVERRVAVG